MNYLKPIFYFLLLIFVSSCNNAADSPYPALSFYKVTTMPGTGRASAVSFVIDNKAYIALGRTAVRSGALNDCWRFNPVDSSWLQMADFPGKARVKATAAVVSGKAYVGLGYEIGIGIYNSDACLKDFWMYDPTNDTWTKMADFPSNFTDACGSFVLDNEIYVTSGMNGAGFGNEVWKYVPTDGQPGTWVKLKNFSGRARAGGIAVTNGLHSYFGTGYLTANENDWWEYYPASDSWIQRKSMPDNGRENSVSLTINERIFISTGRHFGGNLTGGEVRSDILEYDINKNVWYVRGSLPASGRENALSFTINGKGYIGFGENDTENLNDLWSFEP